MSKKYVPKAATKRKNQNKPPLDSQKRNLYLGGIVVLAVIMAIAIAYNAIPPVDDPSKEIEGVAVNSNLTTTDDQSSQANDVESPKALDEAGNATAKPTDSSEQGSSANDNPAAEEKPETRPVTNENQQNQKESKMTNTISINTAKGPIVLQVYPDLMPITVANFEKLVTSGFYNNLTFHRVEDWVIQGGDPRGNGTGGPGWTIQLETDSTLKNVRGALAMAQSQDPNSAGSQFYILKKDAPWLDGQYAVFGKVISGMEVVDQITIGDEMISVQDN